MNRGVPFKRKKKKLGLMANMGGKMSQIPALPNTIRIQKRDIK
jgi:hypothetical protein